jgi:hypothetical protein
MALKLINLNKSETSISFISHNDFEVGTPICFKNIGGGNYTISGTSPNKTINLITSSPHGYVSGTNKRLFVDFSNTNLSSDTYQLTVGGSNNLTISNQSTSVSGSGTFLYYDFLKAKGDNIDFLTEYVISKQSATEQYYSYNAIKTGEIILPKESWDLIKEDNTQGSGLVPGRVYYLSPSTSGKIVSYITPTGSPVLKALSRTQAFIDLSIKSVETGVGDSLTRETFGGDGIQTQFTLLKPPAGTDYTTIFIDGVFQIPDVAWSLSGRTITFSEIPYDGATISIQYARSMLLADASAINKMVYYSETVLGNPKNVFNIPSTPANISSLIVFVGGSIQDQDKYSLEDNVLTFVDSIGVGLQVIVYVLNSSGITTSFDQYVTRKEISLLNDTAISVPSIFGSQSSAQYRIFNINDPRISATVYLKHNGNSSDPDIRVDSNSSVISISKNTSNKFNIYIENNVLNFQNKTGSTLSLRFYKEI